MNYRKTLDGKTWGNFKYDADNDTLWWKRVDDALWSKDENGELVVKYENPPSNQLPYPIDGEFDTVDGALHWIASMRLKPKISEKDLKDLAKAFSELLGCPTLADIYRTTHATKAESKRKVVRDSGSACGKCNERFRCFTIDAWAN